MIFQNIDFHNVSELVPFEDGWKMHRVPQRVRVQCNTGLENTSAYATGVELRFCLRSGCADVHLRTLPIAEGQMAYLYYGSIQGGWQQSAFVINPGPTVIHIPCPGNMAHLQALTDAHHLPYSPQVCRLVLPYGTQVFLGVDGDVAPPDPAQLPRTTYLAYGSSITHGSLGLAMPCSYPFRLAGKLGCDYLNLGFAGTAHCERAMAEWIVSRKDWHFATVEMGINMMGMTDTEFEQRIDEFTGILADDGRRVFATSIFCTSADTPKHHQFRAIVRKYAAPRLHYTDGLDLLERPELIAQDMVHPSLEGLLQIADRWHAVIRRQLPADLINT